MTLTDWLAAVGDVVSATTFVLVYVLHRDARRNRNGRNGRPPVRELRKIFGSEDWRKRRGRFAGLDPDDAEHEQVEPVPEPAAEDQTHLPGFLRRDPEQPPDPAGGDE